MTHHFRKRLIEGELLIGTMVTLGAPEVAEILAAAGFDWLFLDAEHATFTPQGMQRMLQAAGRSTPCLVRLPTAGEVAIKQALDIGAAGIIAPQVNSAEQAEQVVRLAKYAPEGTRGVGIARAQGYGMNFQAYVDSANAEAAVIVQAEHIEAVNRIEAIVAVPGLDAVLVGPYDLSASMGKLGQVTDPEVQQAIEHVTGVCLGAGVRLGIFGLSPAAVQPYIEVGYTLITVGVDTVMLGQAATAILAAFRS